MPSKEQTIGGTLISLTAAAGTACLQEVLLVGPCLHRLATIDPQARDAETHTFPTRLQAALPAGLSSRPGASLILREVPKMTGTWPLNCNRLLLLIFPISVSGNLIARQCAAMSVPWAAGMCPVLTRGADNLLVVPDCQVLQLLLVPGIVILNPLAEEFQRALCLGSLGWAARMTLAAATTGRLGLQSTRPLTSK